MTPDRGRSSAASLERAPRHAETLLADEPIYDAVVRQSVDAIIVTDPDLPRACSGTRPPSGSTGSRATTRIGRPSTSSSIATFEVDGTPLDRPCARARASSATASWRQRVDPSPGHRPPRRRSDSSSTSS